jgi:phosphatidylinositol glycan class M
MEGQMNSWYALAFAGRLGLLLFGIWQDSRYAVKFTDVDYYVFSDAAQFVTQGESPYQRATYRYTPLLAWALTLNVYLSPLIGKLIFITFDVLVGHTIHKLITELGHDRHMARNCALAWLLNPLPAIVSSRGNAESIIAYLVLKALTHLVQGHTVSSSVYYALAIHFKIYPVAFALPIYLYFGGTKERLKGNAEGGRSEDYGIRTLITKLTPSRDQALFVVVSGLILGTLTGIFYLMYGWIFLYETYIYHIFRGDIRHNFSPYFYLLYLTSDPIKGVPLCLRLLVFLPQAVLAVTVALRFYRDQPLCWFLCTFVFVMANKVCTSQYFLWYLCLLPVILPHLKMTVTKSASLLLLWFSAQGVWLLPAYMLEFQGYNTFLVLWAAGLVFFCANSALVWLIIKNYKVKLRGLQNRPSSR